MSDGIDNILKSIANIVGAVTGIRAAPDYAPSTLPPGVCAVVIPVSGAFEEVPTMVKQGLHTVNLYVMQRWADSEKVLEQMIPFGDSVPAALMNDRTLGGYCTTYGEISYTFGPIAWNPPAGVQFDAIGYIFTISGIKHQDTTSITSTT